MESEINRKIREVLEMFEVDTTKVIGQWNIIGHLKNVLDPPHSNEGGEDE